MTAGLRSEQRFSADRAASLANWILEDRDLLWDSWAVSARLSWQLPPEIADEVADAILVALPEQPSAPEVLAEFLAAIPSEPVIIIPSEPNPPVVAAGLPVITDVGELAASLNLDIGELEWFADRGTWLRTARVPLRHYRITRIPKRDGVRIIEAPKPRLAEIQRKILRRILDHRDPHPAACGFRRGKSVAHFAWPHTDRPVVLRLDLRHCFTTIGTARVRRVFADCGYSPAVSRVLAELSTTTTSSDALGDLDPWLAAMLRARHLPQGAPTSPALANLVMIRLDRRLAGYARRHALRYTRYGDDLAFSGDAMDADRVLWAVLRIVAAERFVVHPDKTRIMGRHQRQQLAGLVVNDHPQVPRAEFDALKALLHNAITTGASTQNHAGHPDFRAHIYGRIAWVGATNASRRERLLALADQVDWSA
ncbi:RNA-directed DNA polymerase [Williamsia sp. CHRR-6]|nr:RNA-directed DNA polymerase [Williamsia sp. CHRR-6]